MPYKDKKKQSAFNIRVNRERRLAWLQANGPCKQCQSWDRLEVDHIEPALKISHKIWSWAEQRRVAELEKCQVLCHDCHLRKTLADKPQRQHGTHSMYVAGCRCQPCRDGHSQLKREYLARKASTLRSTI